MLPCRVDFNHNGIVDAGDLREMVGQWHQVIPTGSAYDLSGDRQVGVDDIALVPAFLGRACSFIPTEANLKVAFIADQGFGKKASAVLQLIADEKADMVLHQGDFDYNDDPDAWDKQISSLLGPDFPYFASIGNHDTDAWLGYQQKLQARLGRISGATCSGDLGVKSVCRYKGLFFILSGAGTRGSGHDVYIRDQLAADNSIWRICTWHKNQHDMQAGGKKDEVGWQPYRVCQGSRAIIATGHEHTYSRTLTLTDVGNRAKGHGATGQPDQVQVGVGKTFVFVSGLGGQTKRDYHPAQHDDDTWWATIYTSDYYLRNGEEITNYNYDYGALFVTFYVDGDPTKARGYFKNIDGEIIDTFDIVID